MKYVLALLLALICGTASAEECQPVNSVQIEQMRSGMDAVLADGMSARYKDVCRPSFSGKIKKDVFCGFLNQKNKYGAYTGYVRFGVILGDGRRPAVVDDDGGRAALIAYCTMCGHDQQCASMR